MTAAQTICKSLRNIGLSTQMYNTQELGVLIGDLVAAEQIYAKPLNPPINLQHDITNPDGKPPMC